MVELSDLRIEIDRLNIILANAYQERFSYIQEIAKFKPSKISAWDIGREAFIFKEILSRNSKNEVYFIASLIESQMILSKLTYPQWSERNHLMKKQSVLSFWEKQNPLAVKICEPNKYKKLLLKKKIKLQLEGI